MKILKYLPFVILLALDIGCTKDDNPASSSEEHEHLEADGVLLIMGNDSLYVKSGDENDVVGSFTITEGDTTEEIEVFFYHLEDDEWFQPEHDHDGREEVELDVEEVDTSLLEIHLEDHHWEFRLSGLTHGDTYIRVITIHENHADYISPRLPVTVN
ncbi:hypothetical protein K8I28_08200 [bacterium]|nr:hypothetical protein [bacterium]